MNFLDGSVLCRYQITQGYRRRRSSLFWTRLGRRAGTRRCLHLGGGPGNYLASELNALGQNAPRVILLDLGEAELLDARRHFLRVRADDKHLPFREKAFNLMFCNSVIEPVAHPATPAPEIRQTGQRFLAQTPNGNFPLARHSHVPLLFLGQLERARQRVLCRFVSAPNSYTERVRTEDV